MTPLLLALACTRSPTPPDTSPETGSETGADSAQDSASDTGTAPDRDYRQGITLQSQDTESWGELGYVHEIWEIGPDFELPLLAPDGAAPRFHLLAPQSGGQDRPLLVVFHGSSTDIDDQEPAGDFGRCTTEHASEQIDGILRASPTLRAAVARGWVVALPENPFCDGWIGQGPNDPVDSEHAGALHAELSVGFARWGRDSLSIGPVYALGSSLGAPGATAFALRQELAGLAFDSGAGDFVRYYWEEDYSPFGLEIRQARGDHTLGGPPTAAADDDTPSAFYDSYRDMSLERALLDGRVALPVWSENDGGAPAVQNQDIAALLAAHSPAPWLDYEVAKATHTQAHDPSSAFVGVAMTEFLSGRSVQLLEAESGTGVLGQVVEGTQEVEKLSGTGARRSAPADGPGLLWESSSASEVTRGLTVRASIFLDLTGQSDADLVTLKLIQGGQVLAERTLAPGALEYTLTDHAAGVAWMEALTLEAESEGGAVTVQVWTEGTGVVLADVAVLSW